MGWCGTVEHCPLCGSSLSLLNNKSVTPTVSFPFILIVCFLSFLYFLLFIFFAFFLSLFPFILNFWHFAFFLACISFYSHFLFSFFPVFFFCFLYSLIFGSLLHYSFICVNSVLLFFAYSLTSTSIIIIMITIIILPLFRPFSFCLTEYCINSPFNCILFSYALSLS